MAVGFQVYAVQSFPAQSSFQTEAQTDLAR